MTQVVQSAHPSSALNQRTGKQRRFVYRLTLAAWRALFLLNPWTTAALAEDDRAARVYVDRGWSTFGQVLSPGFAASGLKVGDLPTQCDIKVHWPDGSIRFAIVTVKADVAGRYAIRSGSTLPGSVDYSPPPATVTITIKGQPWRVVPSVQPSGDNWLSGPLVCERREIASPLDMSGNAHPFLRLFMDVRTYADGTERLDVTCDNTLDDVGAAEIQYDVAIDYDGARAFQKSGVAHPYLTRWRKVLASTASAAAVTDLHPFQAAGALPVYRPSASKHVDAVSGAKFDILGSGLLNADMTAHGGRPELAPYPDWTARYLVHHSARHLAVVLRHGELAGSWPVHICERQTGRFQGIGGLGLVSIDERPGFWLDHNGRGDPGETPAGKLTTDWPLIPDNAHAPSLAYVPYLITGDRFYADELAFWSNYGLLHTFQDNFYHRRQGSAGLLVGNETRGIAWVMRNLADAAAYLPDSDPVKPYLAQKLLNNLRWADEYAVDHQTPLETVFETADRAKEGKVGISLWENNYVAWAIDHANRQGFSGGTKLRDRIARFQCRLYTDSAFPRDCLGVGAWEVGVRNGDRLEDVSYFASLPELVEANIRDQFIERGKPLSGYYGVDQRLMLMIAEKNGLSGATEALKALEAAIGADLDNRSGWGIEAEEQFPPP